MKQRGFTLIELIMVLTIVGILAVYVSSSTTTVSMASYSGAEELAQAIRYAQQEAMNNTAAAGIGITIAANGFTFVGVASPVSTWRLSIPNGVQYSVLINPTGTITFDNRGVPTCGGGLACAAGSQVITVTADGVSDTLTIEPFTGLVRR